MSDQDRSPSHSDQQPGGPDRTHAMTGGADEKVKTKPSPSAEEASPAPKPNTPTTPG